MKDETKELELVSTVTLLDENQKEVQFDHLMTFEHDEKHYIALMPLDAVEGIGDDEVLILEVVSSDGEDAYVPVENEILLEEVFDTFMELMDEEENEE